MTKFILFLQESKAQFRWEYFSVKRMVLFSISFFLFFMAWRLLFGVSANEILITDFLLRKGIQAIIMGIIFGFRKPAQVEETH